MFVIRLIAAVSRFVCDQTIVRAVEMKLSWVLETHLVVYRVAASGYFLHSWFATT